jgi:hypothetical protein
MLRKYNGFVSKARVSACMYFLVKAIILFYNHQVHSYALRQCKYFSHTLSQVLKNLTFGRQSSRADGKSR